MLQHSDHCFSGISVEAADNLSNQVIESTAFCKKVLKEHLPESHQLPRGGRLVSNKSGL